MFFASNHQPSVPDLTSVSQDLVSFSGFGDEMF